MDKLLLNINEIAQALSLKPPTIRKWVRTNSFPCIKLGNKAVRFKMDDVNQWVNQQQNREPPASTLDVCR